MREDRETKILWVFGAGASTSSGFPVSCELFHSAINLLRKHSTKKYSDNADCLENRTDWSVYLSSNENDDPVRRRLRNGLSRTFKDLLDDLLYCHIIDNAVNILKTNPEEIIKAIDDLQPSSRHTRWPKGSFTSLKDKMRENAEKTYFYILSEFNTDNSIRERNPYRDLVCLHRGPDRGHWRFFETKTKIISFNYDTLLDEALSKYHLRFWNYEGIRLSAINGISVSAGLRDISASTVSLIKPHGSLNFMYCPKCQGTAIYDDWVFKDTGPGSMTSNNRYCSCSSMETGHMRSQLTPPVYRKDLFFLCREAMERSLAWCNKLIVVGYSFPDQDSHVQEVLAAGIQANRSKQIQILVIDQNMNKAKKICARIKKTLGSFTKKIKTTPCPYRGMEFLDTAGKRMTVLNECI